MAGHEALALLAGEQMTPSQRARLRRRFLQACTADASGGLRSTGVRWWLKYCVGARGIEPYTVLTQQSPLSDKVEAENLLMDFAIWLALSRPSGRQIAARTIRKYVSQVRSWHLREFRTDLTGGLDPKLISDLIKGIERLVQQPARRRRWGVRTQDLAEAIRRHLSAPEATAANWAAALTVAFCGLLRGGEFAVGSGDVFDPTRHLTRADVTFVHDAKGRKCLQLRMRVGKSASPEKDTLILLGGGGSLLDPVAAVERLLALDPVPRAHDACTPLFRSADGSALTVRGVRAMIKLLMASLGLDERRFGAHSLRIGGATAGLAAGLSPAALRAAGRWSSDVYQLYARASAQALQLIATVVGSTPFEDLERSEFLNGDILTARSEAATAAAKMAAIGAAEPALLAATLADIDAD